MEYLPYASTNQISFNPCVDTMGFDGQNILVVDACGL